MKIKALKLLTLAFLLIACALPVLFLSGRASSEPDPSLAGIGLGSLETFNANYKAWETQYLKNGGDQNMVLAMGWFKGLSTGSSYASGLAKFNLVEGNVTVAINGLSQDEAWDVWMVDSAAGRTIALENDDVSHATLGQLVRDRAPHDSRSHDDRVRRWQHISDIGGVRA